MIKRTTLILLKIHVYNISNPSFFHEDYPFYRNVHVHFVHVVLEGIILIQKYLHFCTQVPFSYPTSKTDLVVQFLINEMVHLAKNIIFSAFKKRNFSFYQNRYLRIRRISIINLVICWKLPFYCFQ